MKSQRSLALFLSLVLALTLLPACSGSPSPSVTPTSPPPSQTVAPTPPPDPIREQLDTLTIEEKVGQLLVAGIEGYVPDEDATAAIRDIKAGGIILFKRNVASTEQLHALSNSLKAMNDGQIPLFLCVDEEGGLVSRMPAELTDLPPAFVFGSQEDPSLCDELGQALGAQCASFGFNMDFAPVMDVWSNPSNTVIGKRAFSTDAATVADRSLRTAQALTNAGVIPVGKHFPGHGDTLVDSHAGLPVVEKTVEELEQQELLPFRHAIENEIPVLMIAHILMTQIDPERPASLSHPVVTGLLREELGFEGLVCTDDLTMAAVSDTYGMGEAAVLAVEAGCDLLLVCHGADNLREAYDSLLEAVRSGRISEERLVESVHRILALKSQYALTNLPSPLPQIDELNRQLSELLKKMDL